MNAKFCCQIKKRNGYIFNGKTRQLVILILTEETEKVANFNTKKVGPYGKRVNNG